VAPHRNLGGVGSCRVAPTLQPVRKPSDSQVVSVRGLVVDERDGAGRAGAERVLDGGVGVASGADQDILGGLVRRPLNLIERAAVRRIERANRAVGRTAGRAGSLIDVARSGGASTGGRSTARRRSRGRAARAGNSARAAGGTAAATLGGGAALFILGNRMSRMSGVAVTPLVSAGTAGVSAQGAF